MKITADLGAGILTLPGAKYTISNRVRTLKNGGQRRDEVIRSIPGGCPYDPLPFPEGAWNIIAVEWQKDKGFDPKVYGPVKIRTDAKQWVNVWKLDGDGDYLEETAQLVWDTGYLLHYTPSSTTLGCIRLASPEDATAAANTITALMRDGPVELEVI
jgi:hypothetical protein